MTNLPAHHSNDVDDCAFRSFLDRVADKWSLLLIVTLENAPKQRRRFSELKKSVPGISQRMLTTTLRNLERDGLLVRHFFPEIPPRVEYELTTLGKNLMCPIGELVQWIRQNWTTITNARNEFDKNNMAKSTGVKEC
ncbi:MAG: helix-turn-helix domain-containing protein [Gammaproteobacteria bacterium]|nr:helix-turn-helix domain-containing protein [Gammaproteobacteria bacterium]